MTVFAARRTSIAVRYCPSNQACSAEAYETAKDSRLTSLFSCTPPFSRSRCPCLPAVIGLTLRHAPAFGKARHLQCAPAHYDTHAAPSATHFEPHCAPKPRKPTNTNVFALKRCDRHTTPFCEAIPRNLSTSQRQINMCSAQCPVPLYVSQTYGRKPLVHNRTFTSSIPFVRFYHFVPISVLLSKDGGVSAWRSARCVRRPRAGQRDASIGSPRAHAGRCPRGVIARTSAPRQRLDEYPRTIGPVKTWQSAARRRPKLFRTSSSACRLLRRFRCRFRPAISSCEALCRRKVLHSTDVLVRIRPLRLDSSSMRAYTPTYVAWSGTQGHHRS